MSRLAGQQETKPQIKFEEDLENSEEEIQKKPKQEDLSKFFLDREGNTFDPCRKFGSIEDGSQLIYDDITTSYKLNLPSDYYLGMIKRQLPSLDKDPSWFIKPHHLESLTQHNHSLKDDLLNTHYYSHYNQQYGVQKPEDFAETALEYINYQIQHLKKEQENMAPSKGINFDSLDELKSQVKR